MRLLQVHTFYDRYLHEFYKRRPVLLHAPYEELIQALIKDGFGAGHIFAPTFRELGYDADLVIANDIISQYRWARSHDVTLSNPAHWQHELLRRQVEILQPDFLYLNDPIMFDSRFIGSLSKKPKFVLGWRAAPVAPDTNWTGFDLILSHLSVSRQQALHLGAKHVEHFYPGFPSFLADTVCDVPKEFDVIFSGQWSRQHTQRNAHIVELTKAASAQAGLSLGLFLATLTEGLPPEIARYNQGGRWGLEMFRALRSGRIAVNAESDLNRGEAGNMRLFETTGIGSFLLTEHQPNIQQYFNPGTEIETFRDKGELMEKTRYYLEHPDKREAIAQAGQKRCLEEYSIKNRVAALDSILRRYLGLTTGRSSSVGTTSSQAAPEQASYATGIVGEDAFQDMVKRALEEFGRNAFDKALDLLDQAIQLRVELLGLRYGRAVALGRLGRKEEAVAVLRSLLTTHPAHTKAACLLQELTNMETMVQKSGSKSHGKLEEAVALVTRAVQLLNQGQAVQAMRLADQAVSLGHEVPGMHYLRTACLNAVGRHEEALEAAKAELRINPNHKDAQAQVSHLSQALLKPKARKIPPEQRTWSTTLPREMLHAIQNASHNYLYRGIPMIKNPFDFQLYPLLVWNVKPRTIIEIGSKNGGSALWLADMLENFGIDGRVYSVDIVRVVNVTHSRITFLEGDGRELQQTFTPEFLASLPRPLLVIEDADHSYQTSKHVLEFFHPVLNKDEYIVIEDGIISDLSNDATFNSGPHRALKEFLAAHPQEYHIDEEYCDYFGYNLTWNTNGYLKRLTPKASCSGTDRAVEHASLTRADALDRELGEVLSLVRSQTRLSQESLGALAVLAKTLCDRNTAGNFVAYGSGAAGVVALLAHVVKQHSRQPRLIHWVQPPTDHDAAKLQNTHPTGPTPLLRPSNPSGQLLEGIAEKLGVNGMLRVWSPPSVEDFLRVRDWLGMVALLQINAGSQSSIRRVLESFYGSVVDDGILAFDGNGDLDGVIHEFEKVRHLSFKLQTSEPGVRWCAKPERFPINPNCPQRLVEEFSQDDPVSVGALSQMSANERFQLYYSVRELLPRTDKTTSCFIEIGSYAGASLELIYKAFKRRARFVQGIAVEPAGQPQFFEVIKRLAGEVVHIPALSREAAPHLIEFFKKDGNYPLFIMIDGDHTYQGVHQDILDYYPLLAPGGILAFHDYLPAISDENREAILYHHANQEPGIRRACSELMEQAYGCKVLEIPLLRPSDPTQTQAHLPIIPGVFSTVRAYRKPKT